MKKEIILDFTCEEAALLINVFTAYLENVNTLQLKLPAIDIVADEIDFVDESLPLLKDGVALEIGVILQCPVAIKHVLLALALLTASLTTEETDTLNTQCMIKLFYASRGGR